MTNIRFAEVNDDASIALPQALADKLGVRPGDRLSVVETENGIEIRGRLSTPEAQLELAKHIMDEDEAVLRKLAE